MSIRLNTARTRIVKTAAALALSAAAAGIVTAGPAAAVAGDPSQWGRAKAEASVERHVNEYEGEKVNEYEGQHR